MLTPSEIRDLLRSGESSTLELKVNTPYSDNLARLLSSFANAEGGTVIVGVEEPDTIVGTNPKRFEQLLQRSLTLLQGDVQLDHYVIALDEKSVGVIHVSPSKTPVASPEGYFCRIGAADQALSAEQLVARMSAIPNHSAAIESLSQTVSTQTAEIGKLRESFEKANSWKRKAFYALLGATATAIVKLVLVAMGLTGG